MRFITFLIEDKEGNPIASQSMLAPNFSSNKLTIFSNSESYSRWRNKDGEELSKDTVIKLLAANPDYELKFLHGDMNTRRSW